MNSKASAFSRFLGLMADVSIGHGLFYYLLSFSSISTYFKKFDSFLVPFYKLLGPESEISIGFLVATFTLTIIFRFYFTLIFGVSFGQAIAGIRSKGSGVWPRFGGAARVLLELVTMPLLILELPVLTGKRSIGESLTSTYLVEKEGGLQFVFKSLFVPLLVLTSFFSPLLQELTLIDGLVVSFSSERAGKLKGREDFRKYKTYPSNRFRFKTFSSLGDGRFILLPSFEITKQGKKKKIVPYITIYDKKNGVDGNLRLIKQFKLFSILEKGIQGNFLFKASYPELNKVLHEERNLYERMRFDPASGALHQVNALAVDQIENLIQDSFELSLAKMWSHILRRGPFVKGYVDIRNSFLSLIREGAVPEVDITQIGEDKFLRFSQSFSWDQEEIIGGNKEQIESLIPIGTNNSLIFEFGWAKDMKSALSRREFKENFLATANWFFDYKETFSFPTKGEEMTPFHIIDYFTKGNLTQEQVDGLEDYMFQYNYDLARMAVEEKNLKLQKLIALGLNRYSQIALIRNKIKKGFFSRNFLLQMKTLERALRAQDQDFFNL